MRVLEENWHEHCRLYLKAPRLDIHFHLEEKDKKSRGGTKEFLNLNFS